jgi:hypothetical protein
LAYPASAVRRDRRTKSLSLIEIAPACVRRTIARALANRALANARARGGIDMNAIPDLNKTMAIAASGQTRAAAAPRLKLSSRGYSIDHPDPELGERLMADALGIADRDAMHGICGNW